jgi:hypothetical protein
MGTATETVLRARAGTWVYHYYDIPESDDDFDDDSTTNTTHYLKVDVLSFTGEIEFTISVDEPPIRIAPPYAIVEDGGSGKASVCGAEPGHR